MSWICGDLVSCKISNQLGESFAHKDQQKRGLGYVAPKPGVTNVMQTFVD